VAGVPGEAAAGAAGFRFAMSFFMPSATDFTWGGTLGVLIALSKVNVASSSFPLLM
jgi:hypothetical protein